MVLLWLSWIAWCCLLDIKVFNSLVDFSEFLFVIHLWFLSQILALILVIAFYNLLRQLFYFIFQLLNQLLFNFHLLFNLLFCISVSLDFLFQIFYIFLGWKCFLKRLVDFIFEIRNSKLFTTLTSIWIGFCYRIVHFLQCFHVF